MERSTMGIDVWKRILTTFHRAISIVVVLWLEMCDIISLMYVHCELSAVMIHTIFIFSFHFRHLKLGTELKNAFGFVVVAAAASATLRVMWRNCSSLLCTVFIPLLQKPILTIQHYSRLGTGKKYTMNNGRRRLRCSRRSHTFLRLLHGILCSKTVLFSIPLGK